MNYCRILPCPRAGRNGVEGLGEKRRFSEFCLWRRVILAVRTAAVDVYAGSGEKRVKSGAHACGRMVHAARKSGSVMTSAEERRTYSPFAAGRIFTSLGRRYS